MQSSASTKFYSLLKISQKYDDSLALMAIIQHSFTWPLTFLLLLLLNYYGRGTIELFFKNILSGIVHKSFISEKNCQNYCNMVIMEDFEHRLVNKEIVIGWDHQ
jgi:hypothetical protein